MSGTKTGVPAVSGHTEPRAHWPLLTVTLFTLVGAMLLNGYVRGELDLKNKGDHTKAHVGGAYDQVPAQVIEGGPVIDARQEPARAIDPPAKTVILSFDDGPDPVWTPKVLDVLRRQQVPATFFVIGSQVAAHPDLVHRMVAEGHEVGLHTFTHPDMSLQPVWRQRLELSQTQLALAGAAGITTSIIRPPYSSEADALDNRDWAAARVAARQGYLEVLVNRDSMDWAKPGVDRIVQNSLPADPKDDRGVILLMHDAGGDRSQTVAALDRIITEYRNRGYRFTTTSGAFALPSTHANASPADRARGLGLIWTIRVADWVVTSLVFLFVFAGILMVIRLVVLLVAAGFHARVRRRRVWGAPVTAPVSVVIPAFNEKEGIANTVRTLAASDHPALEIIVVDDGSTDGTADIAESLGMPNVRVIRKPNGGKPSALNAGIAASRNDLLILVDGDTVFETDTVRQVIQPFADPEVGAVSGNAKVGNRRGLLGRWQHIEYVMGFNLDRRCYDLLECMPTVPGAIGAFRREALLEVGGVSDDTLAEDTDLTMALLRAGWRVVYEEKARAWTEAPATLGQLWKQRYRWCYGTLQAMWKHRRALFESGPGGRLGRRGLPFFLLFQVLLPLIAPAMDAFLIYGLLFLDPVQTAVLWTGLMVTQLLIGAFAFRLDRERLGPLWALPVQQLVYRQLMYLVVIQSVITAMSGGRMRWHKLKRTGQVDVPPRMPVGT